MPDKRKKLSEITDSDLLDGEVIAAPTPAPKTSSLKEITDADLNGGVLMPSSSNIDTPSLAQDIADIESAGGDYTAVNPKSSAAGKYQFLWNTFGGDIAKVTGVKTKEDFLKNPKAQEDFFNYHVENNLKPTIERLRRYNKSGYSDSQLAKLIHFKGEGGAMEFLTAGKDATRKNNISIPAYLGTPEAPAPVQNTVAQPAPTSATPDWQNPQATIDLGPAPKGVSQGSRPAAGLTEGSASNALLPINSVIAEPNPEKTRTQNYSEALAGDVASVAQSGASPEYAENLQKYSIDNPGSVVYQLTDPKGNPEFTGQYFKYRLQNLKQQQQEEEMKLAQQLQPGQTPSVTPADIAEKYAQKERQLREATSHMIALQLANKEFSNKEAEPQPAQGASTETMPIDYAPESGIINPREEGLMIEQAKRNEEIAKRNKQYDATRLGMEQAILLGDPDAEKDLKKYNSGLTVKPERKVAYESNGYQLMQEAKGVAAEKGDAPLVDELAKHSDAPQKRLEEKNPEFFRKMWGNIVGDYAFNKEKNPVWGTIFSRPKLTPDEIKKYGKEAGLEDYQIAQLTPDDVPVASWLLGQAAQSAFNTFLFKDETSPGGKFFTGDMPQAQHALNNYKGVLGEMAGGVGMMAGFVGQSGILGKAFKGAEILGDVVKNAKRYETASNMIPLAITNYNSAYHTANEVIGDAPEDAAKRNLYALTVGAITTTLMGLDPLTKLGKQALESSAKKNLANILKGADLSTLTKKEYQTAVQKTIQSIPKFAEGAAETIKHAGSQALIMGSAKMAENVANMVFDPEHRHGLMDNVGEAAISGAVAMFVPSLMAGIGSVRANTPMNRDIMIDVGMHPERYTDFVSKELAGNKITPEEAQQMHDGIIGMRQAIQQTPAANIDGQRLTMEQGKDYAFNLFQENRIEQKVQELQGTEGAPIDKAQLDPLKKRISELQKERGEILGKAGEEVPLPERAPEPEKKEAEKVAEPEEKNVSLTPTSESLTEKTTENETISRRNEGQSNTEQSKGEEERPNTEVQNAASREVPGREEDRQLEEPTTANKIKAAKEQPLSVSEKKKKLAELIEEEPEDVQAPPEDASKFNQDVIVDTDKAAIEGFHGDHAVVYGERTPLPKEGLVISEAYLKTGAPKGKGHGQEVYKKALDEYGTLYSAWPTSEDAIRAQDKLVEKGIATIRVEDIGGQEFRVIEKANQGAEPSTERRNEVPSEPPASVTKKENENASTQSQELQQESLQQGSEPEHARTEQAGSKEAPAETENRNSDQRSAQPQEAVKPVSRKNAHKKGWSLRHHLQRKERVAREEPKDMEEYILQTMLGMSDKEPENKWAFSSVEKDIPKGYTERQIVKQFASDHPRATPIDVWAQDAINSVGEQYGNLPFHVPDAQEITNMILDNISRFRTKEKLLEHVEGIQAERRRQEYAAENKRYELVEIGKDEDGKPVYDYIDLAAEPTEHELAMQYAGVKGEEFEGYNDEGHPIFKELSEKYDQIDEAKVKAEDEQKIKDFYASHFNEHTGEVNYDAAHTDYNALQELKKGLSDAGRELMDSIVPFNDFAEHNETIQRLIKEVNAYEKQRRENTATAVPEEGVKPEGVTEGGGAPREPEGQQESASKQRLAAIEEELIRQRASQKRETELRIKADKADDIEGFNKHNENWYKKQDKINRLLDEKERILRSQKEEAIKEGYTKTADRIRKFGERITAGSEQTVGAFPGISPKLVKKFIDGVADIVEATGNIHLAIHRMIQKFNEEHPEEKITQADMGAIKEYVEYLAPPKTEAPVISAVNKKAADGYLELLSDGVSYNEVVDEIMSREGISDRTRAKILDYIDWHTKDRDIFNTHVLREPQREKTYLQDYSLTPSGELSTYISGRTLEDVQMDEVQFALRSKETQLLENVVNDAANMVGLAKSHAGSEDVLTFGPEMLDAIHKMPEGSQDLGVKKLLAVTGLHNELHAERLRLESEMVDIAESNKPDESRFREIEKRLVQIKKLTGQTEILYRDITSNASNVLNAARANRIFRNTFFGDLYADKILDEQTRAKKEKTEEALGKVDISDAYATEGAFRPAETAAADVKQMEQARTATEAGKNVAEDLTPTKRKERSDKGKSRSVVQRIKEKVTGKKEKAEDGRKEIVDKKTAETKANEYLGGSSIEDLFAKAKEQTKKPC